jgi:hypothetical protein
MNGGVACSRLGVSMLTDLVLRALVPSWLKQFLHPRETIAVFAHMETGIAAVLSQR